MAPNSQSPSAGRSRAQRSRILNAWVDSLAVTNVVENFDDGVLFTINPEHLYHLQRNPEFSDAYANANYVTCDSLYVYWVLKLLGRGVEHRASGSDIVPAYWRHHAANPAVTIFLLAALPAAKLS
jgi:UDP-N-acetyl-D-mannosaminuronic acid transferase (WecB/TagA/CpsF family)